MDLRVSKVLSRIESAIQTGEILTVTYNGGSQPGVVRQIVPVKFQESDKVIARCLLSGMTKCFVIEKISIIDDETGEITSVTFRNLFTRNMKTSRLFMMNSFQ